jgi:hypothetical protein
VGGNPANPAKNKLIFKGMKKCDIDLMYPEAPVLLKRGMLRVTECPDLGEHTAGKKCRI